MLKNYIIKRLSLRINVTTLPSSVSKHTPNGSMKSAKERTFFKYRSKSDNTPQSNFGSLADALFCRKSAKEKSRRHLTDAKDEKERRTYGVAETRSTNPCRDAAVPTARVVLHESYWFSPGNTRVTLERSSPRSERRGGELGTTEQVQNFSPQTPKCSWKKF